MNNQHEKIIITQFTTVGWVFIGSVITCTVCSLGFLSIEHITYQCFLQLICLAAVIAGLASISTEVVSTSIGTRKEVAHIRRQQQVPYARTNATCDVFTSAFGRKIIFFHRDKNGVYVQYGASFK